MARVRRELPLFISLSFSLRSLALLSAVSRDYYFNVKHAPSDYYSNLSFRDKPQGWSFCRFVIVGRGEGGGIHFRKIHSRRSESISLAPPLSFLLSFVFIELTTKRWRWERREREERERGNLFAARTYFNGRIIITSRCRMSARFFLLESASRVIIFSDNYAKTWL